MSQSTLVYVRDVLLIVATILLMGVTVMLAVLGWRVWSTMQVIRQQVEAILESLKTTADALQDTVAFVGKRGVADRRLISGAGRVAELYAALSRARKKGADGR
jgi:hypothetical protein